MSIEKNIETLANNSDRIAAALEGILAELAKANSSAPALATTGAEPDTKVTASKADKKPKSGKAEEPETKKEEKPAPEQVADTGKKSAETVSYDSIKAIVTEMAGTPDGVTAIKSVLKSFGVAKASDLAEEKWGELLVALEKAKGGSADEEFA